MTDASPLRYCLPPNRGVLAITGEDRVAFLQGLVSNDVRLATPERAIYAWFMTPQGKYLHDFIIFETGDALLLDVEADRRADLLKRLKMYKLRSKIALEDRSENLRVAVLYGDGAAAAVGLGDGAGRGAARPCGAAGYAALDPRRDGLGARLILPAGEAETALEGMGAAAAPFADYDGWRIRLGVADGARDLIPEKSIALENDMDALGAMSWDKGCYMGQELNARTKYRNLAKKRLAVVAIEGDSPAPGTPVMRDGREVGEMRSSCGGLGLALLRLDELTAAENSAEIPFAADDKKLQIID